MVKLTEKCSLPQGGGCLYKGREELARALYGNAKELAEFQRAGVMRSADPEIEKALHSRPGRGGLKPEKRTNLLAENRAKCLTTRQIDRQTDVRACLWKSCLPGKMVWDDLA